MGVRTCRVSVSDMDGVRHSAQVTASTLYEAVALGLAAIRAQDWTGDLSDGLGTIEVVVSPIPVTHSVKIQDFHKWLNQQGRSPRDVTQRERIRAILRGDGKR